MFGISGVYICVARVRGNILWLGNGAPASAVGLSCLRHLAAIVVARGSSGGSSVKDYLVSFCMYVICGFRPTLGGAILPVPVVSSSSMGEVFRGVLLARSLPACVCFVCFMCCDWSVCSRIFVPCFTFVYFGVGFIWRDGGNAVPSLFIYFFLLGSRSTPVF